MLSKFALGSLLFFLRVVRIAINADSRTYAGLSLGWLQPLLERIGKLKAFAVYERARAQAPAYQAFLRDNARSPVRSVRDWAAIPITTKENYVKKYSIEERCYGGRIPARGVVIDESSGSSGLPNNWVRGPEERENVKKIIQLSYALLFKDERIFMLNCFALGPWATGMNVSMSLSDVGIMKSLGPDQSKLEHTLELFGPGYDYVVLGYPPFIKMFVDTTRLDLSKFNLRLIVGGEGISEGLRAYLSRTFKMISSSYGASDLEINIGIETDLTIKLRKLCAERPALSQALFGRTQPPMIFQFNPLDYTIEKTAEGELVFTINRLSSVAPKIRYDLKDMGGMMTHRDLSKALKAQGIAAASLAERQARFPVLFVFGRGDLTVPFYGAKIFPTDVEWVINCDPALIRNVNSFQIISYEDEQINRRLLICLEKTKAGGGALDAEALRTVFYEGLKNCNQDFREVSKLFSTEQIRVEIHAYESGPFADRDIRIKSTYIGKPS